MRRFSALLTTALALGVTAPLMAQSGSSSASSFVYVDTQRLLEAAPGAADAQETWNREIAQMQTEVRDLQTELDSLVADYRRQESMLTEEGRTSRQQVIAQKQQDIQQRTVELETQAGQRRAQLLEPILERVRAVIDTYRTENGYLMVFDASSAGLVSADSALDVTDAILARLQTAPATSSSQP